MRICQSRSRCCCLSASPPAASAAEADAFRRKQQAQEKARGLAGELVAAVLDIQLRQLEENGLKGLPIYHDIASMKGNIGELMKDDMEAIVQLLVEAQEGTQAERLAKFNEARGKIREVVVQLMAERQKLYRRMQIAKLAAEVRQLIALETKAYNTTKGAAAAQAGRSASGWRWRRSRTRPTCRSCSTSSSRRWTT